MNTTNTCACFGLRCRAPFGAVCDETPADDQAIAFAAWAHDLPEFPGHAEVRERYGVDDDTAHRWRRALAAAYGLSLAEEGGDDVR